MLRFRERTGGFALSPELTVAHTANVLGTAGEGVGCCYGLLWHRHLLKSFSSHPSINQKCSQTVFKKRSNVHKNSILPLRILTSLYVCDGGIWGEGDPKLPGALSRIWEWAPPSCIWFGGGGPPRIFPSFCTWGPSLPLGLARNQQVSENMGTLSPPPGPWAYLSLSNVSSASLLPTEPLNLQLLKQSTQIGAKSCPDSWHWFCTGSLLVLALPPFLLATSLFSVSFESGGK